jgi:hypothetical protein
MADKIETQKMIIDLSGRLGLAAKSQGDVNRAQSDPNLRYVGKDGQFADGIFNPLRKYGFISPANATTAQCTLSGSISTIPSVLRCTLFDTANNQIILGYKTRLGVGGFGTGSAVLAFPTTTNSTSILSDMIMYSVNGVRMVLLIRNDRLSIYDPLANMYDLNWSINTAVASQALTANFVAQTDTTISFTTTGYPTSGAVWLQGVTGPAVMATYTGKSGSALTGVVANKSGTVPSGTTVYSGVTGGGSPGLTDCNFNRGILADNGFVYILNGYRVHKFDGTVGGGVSGQLTYDVLNAPKNFTFYDGVDYRGTLILAINADMDSNSFQTRTLQFTPNLCGIYVWDRLSTIVSMRDFIALQGMKIIRRIWISPKGDVLVLAEGSNNSSYLFQYTGTGFKMLQDLGKKACPVTWGGLVTGTNCSYWQGIDGILYGWGAPTANDPDMLFKLLDTNAVMLDKHPNATSLLQVGALLLTQYDDYSTTTGYSTGLENIYGSYSYADGGSLFDTFRYIPHAVDILDSITPKASAGNVYSIVRRLPMFASVNYVRLANLPISSSGTATIATIKIYKDHSATAFTTKTVSQKEAHDGNVYVAVGGDECVAIQIEIEFATTAQLGVDDYCPIYAEVDYEPNFKRR